ncbi:MAG: phage tail protein, partial [Paracoccus sp. (in: a-proteobacteria)]|nr:phage tail protein [Paracoccus sp. (in: a-proteobacteria)]
PLEVGLGLQAHEAGGKLVIESRADLPVLAPVSESEMVAGDPAPVTATRGALEDVAAGAVLTFRDGARDYATATARAVIGAAGPDGVATADLPLVMDAEPANTAAERLLRSALDGREGVAFSLPRSAVDVRPGVVLPVAYHGRPARMMVVDRVTDGEARQVEARQWSDVAWRQSAPLEIAGRAVPILGASGAALRLLDLPLLPGADGAAEWDVWAAAHAQPWPGPVVVGRSVDADGGFSEVASLIARAQIGALSEPLAADRAHVWTPGPLVLRLWSGALVSRPDADVLAGANALAVLHDGAGWEVIQFQGADLTGPGEYRLTRLLRGQRGTEHLAARPLDGGAAVVILTAALMPLGLSEADAGRDFWARFGPAARPITEHALRRHAPGRVGLRPFAPAHLAARHVGGDVVLSWHRRTRRPVTTWPADGSPPPLGEASEAYRIQIGPASAPVRALTVAQAGWTYTADQMAADGISAPFRVAVAQLSDSYGPGVWSEITVR